MESIDLSILSTTKEMVQLVAFLFISILYLWDLRLDKSWKANMFRWTWSGLCLALIFLNLYVWIFDSCN